MELLMAFPLSLVVDAVVECKKVGGARCNEVDEETFGRLLVFAITEITDDVGVVDSGVMGPFFGDEGNDDDPFSGARDGSIRGCGVGRDVEVDMSGASRLIGRTPTGMEDGKDKESAAAPSPSEILDSLRFVSGLPPAPIVSQLGLVVSRELSLLCCINRRRCNSSAYYLQTQLQSEHRVILTCIIPKVELVINELSRL